MLITLLHEKNKQQKGQEKRLTQKCSDHHYSKRVKGQATCPTEMLPLLAHIYIKEIEVQCQPC